MRVPTLSVTLVCFALVLGACGGDAGGEGTSTAATPDVGTTTAPDPADDIGEVIAEVGDVKIGAKEFEAAAARERPADGEALSEEEKREVLQALIEEKMLYLEAKKQGIDRDPKVQKVMVNTLLREDVYSEVRNSDFTMAQLEAYFEEHKEEFVVPEKVQVRRIFVKAGTSRTEDEARALADDLYRKVKAAPDTFKDIAAEQSEDPYKRRGGDLGFLAKEGKPGIEQEVVDQAFGMEEGQISEPFFANGGFHIVKLEKRRERVDRTFDQMKGSVLRQVKNDRYKELYAAYIDQISPSYTIEVDEAALSKIEGRPARRLPMGPDGMPLPGRPGTMRDPGEAPDADTEAPPDEE